MRYLVTAEEMRRYDTNTIERIGIPGMVLMERAALAARDMVMEVLDGALSGGGRQTPEVLVLAGVGNNGGDGLALARLLAEKGCSVTVWCVGDKSKASEQWTRQRHIIEYYGVRFCDTPVSEAYAILIDALFGVGLSREVTGEYAEAIRRFNSLKGYKLALDMPSGICGDTGSVLGCAVHADATITFGFGKRGLYLYPGCECAGTVQVADIGITERAFFDEMPKMFCLDAPEEALGLLPARQGAGNKATFGKVLFIAGSAGMAGAAVLGARAAYRSGAGMVKVLTDERNRVILQEAVPEALYGSYAEDRELEESFAWADVIVVGPGLGKSERARHCLKAAVEKSVKPLVIDADGLNLLAEEQDLQKLLAEQKRDVILTPHVGELSRLTALSVAQLKEGLWQHAAALAESLHAVIVAKDARTFVCEAGKPVCMNIHGNSGMATAGSGDVLAGIIAGLWAQMAVRDRQMAVQGERAETAFWAACAGVRLHAAAGDAAAAKKGEYGCMAGDIAEAAAEVVQKEY
ncbi:MAG: NAD(P)H-hydrate dehydratase [Acetatifactor sp.]|nr:NAD(P)H-hydrate dehydratase [Acetatifactor sp.]